MKRLITTFKKPSKKAIILSALLILAIVVTGFTLVSRVRAAVNIDNSLNFGSLPGYYRYQQNGAASCAGASKYDFCPNGNMFLEIAQKSGPGASVNTTLDVKEIWTKSYIDPDRLNSAIIGVYDGRYSRNVFGGPNEYDASGTRSTFSDNRDVIFEFYTAQDFMRSNGDYDERPCLKEGELTSFYKADSGMMPKNGWAKINVREKLNTSTSACKTPTVTKKTGKIPIYVKAYWRDRNNTEGRVNAFKVSTAYTDKTTDFANTGITGYYSDYANAINRRDDIPSPDQREVGQYAVQNRVDSANTQGRYYFGFAPDCRLAPGLKEKRYIKWKDVDYPDYYPGVDAPRFRLLDVTNPSNVRVVKDVDGTDMDLSGSQLGGPNQYQERQVEFTGGRIYEWHWYNITSRDGIAFWMPYDDYPALVGGCGDWKHELTMKAGTTTTPAVSENPEFRVAGGQTVRVNLNQFSLGKDAGPTTNVRLTVAADGNNKQLITTTFESATASLGGNPRDPASTTYNRVFSWSNLGRLGPSPVYQNQRTDIIADLKVREDAPDGARYCATATMTPGSSTDPGPVPKNPKVICFVVDNSLKPYLTTTGGDVHAGNDCIISTTNPRTPQTIIGQGVAGSARGSSGSYIVSAGDAITKFGSGGSPDSTNLSFGKTGYYGSICRPALEDLQKELAKGGFTSIPGNTATPFNLASLVAGQRYLVYFDGPGTVFGKSSAPVTVYSSGTLTIQGAEFGSNLATVASRTNLPVVGVIAKDIDIKREVTGITAQLYATGNIDTCSDSTASACRSTLLLRGFAMAHDFSFKRSGTGANGLQLAELFGFGAAFYLNPPPGFGTVAGAVKYLGERAPLY